MPGHLIRRLHQASHALFDAQMADAGYDLTPVQYAALYAIAAQPGLDQATLAGNIGFDRVTIGGVVDRLEAKGFVRREVLRGDRRSRHLHVEAAGENILRETAPLVMRVQDLIVQGLSPSERQSFIALLHRTLNSISGTSRPTRNATRTTPKR
jgi:MarR family transcriptional regulator, temperature-dependent positive regulator of motility